MYLTKAEKKFLNEIETVPFNIKKDGYIIAQKEKFNKAVEENLDKKDKEYRHSPYCKFFDQKKGSYYRRANIFQKADIRYTQWRDNAYIKADNLSDKTNKVVYLFAIVPIMITSIPFDIFEHIDRRLHPNHYPPYETYDAIKRRQKQYMSRQIEKIDLKVQGLGRRDRHRIFKKNYIKVDIPKKESK